MSLAIPVVMLLALVGVTSSSKKTSAKTVTKKPSLPVATVPNTYGLLACDKSHRVTMDGQSSTPIAGRASNPDYQWCYVLREEGESAGSIATKILGPEQSWRYVELLTANPHKPTSGKLEDAAGPNGLNFTSLELGETIRIPRSWNSHIDQLGTPSGTNQPFAVPYGV